MVEVGILCHDNPLLLSGYFIEHPIPGEVLLFQIGCVNRIVTRRSKDLLQGWGKVCIDQELHAATKRWLFSYRDRVA